MLDELLPIVLQDMLNWQTLSEVQGFNSSRTLRDKIYELYPKGDEQICFAELEKNVISWLTAQN